MKRISQEERKFGAISVDCSDTKPQSAVTKPRITNTQKRATRCLCARVKPYLRDPRDERGHGVSIAARRHTCVTTLLSSPTLTRSNAGKLTSRPTNQPTYLLRARPDLRLMYPARSKACRLIRHHMSRIYGLIYCLSEK